MVESYLEYFNTDIDVADPGKCPGRHDKLHMQLMKTPAAVTSSGSK